MSSADLRVAKTRMKTFEERLIASRTSSAELVRQAEALDEANDIPGLLENKLRQYVEADNYTNLQLQANQERFRKRKVSREGFEEEQEHIFSKKRLALEEEMRLRERKLMLLAELQERDIAPSMSELTTLVLTETFADAWNKEKKKRGLRVKYNGRQMSWKALLNEKYDGSRLSPHPVVDEDMAREWRCPILQKWIPGPNNVTAAHIVPRSKRDSYVQKLFGVDNAESFIMSHTNGLLMHSSLEHSFDKGMFVLVPIKEYAIDERPEYQVRVLNHELLKEKGGKRTMITVVNDKPIFFDDIDRKELVFRNTIRPARRCLFHHAITSMLWAKQMQWTGWEQEMESLVALKNWMTPGKYLSDALLGALWTHVMDRDMPDSLLKATFADSATSDIRSGLLQWRAASEDTKMNDTDGNEDSEDDEEDEETEGVEA